jgi:hypothetical protein
VVTSKLVEVAENYGLVSQEGISEFFKKSDTRNLEKLDADFRGALEDCADSAEGVSSGQFNYLASASFRAEQGCVRPDCRAARMSEFARFSLLYAEKVVFPFYAPTDLAPNWLHGNFRVLAEIRPLVDLGIVVPTQSAPCLCKKCWAGFSPVFHQVRNAAWDAAEQVKVRYLGAKFGRKRYRKNEWAFHLTFPDNFGASIPELLFIKEPKPVLKRFLEKKASEGSDLPIDLVRESGLLMSYFHHSSEDYILQRMYHRKASCAYLSDSGREISLLGKLLGESQEDARSAVLNSMSHDVSLFADIRLETLVNVRQQDGSAFAAYRSALNQAVKQASEKDNSPEQAKQIYSDILYPQLTSLERKYEVLRGRFKKDVLVDIGVPVAALVIGALSGGSHPTAASFLEAVGGLELLRTAGKHWKSIRDFDAPSDTVKVDPLYFLLRMKREHEKACQIESQYLSPRY